MITNKLQIALLVAGDKDACNNFWNSNQKEVLKVCVKFLKNSDDAHDAQQDIYLRFDTICKNFNFKSNFVTYFYKVIANHCINRLNKTKVMSECNIDELSDRVENICKHTNDYCNRLDNIFENKDALDYIHKQISNLPTKQCRAFSLLKVDNLKLEETAKIMKISVSAVNKLLNKAISKLKVCLKNKF